MGDNLRPHLLHVKYDTTISCGRHAKSRRALFPECDIGAEPPFGTLFDLDTVVDTSLTKDDEIVFNAGSHWQTVRMRYDDYARIVHPKIAKFAEHR